jgi:hypothetical protein
VNLCGYHIFAEAFRRSCNYVRDQYAARARKGFERDACSPKVYFTRRCGTADFKSHRVGRTAGPRPFVQQLKSLIDRFDSAGKTGSDENRNGPNELPGIHEDLQKTAGGQRTLPKRMSAPDNARLSCWLLRLHPNVEVAWTPTPAIFVPRPDAR